MDKIKNLFRTPCAAHCIDFMLEDMTKIKVVEKCVEEGKKITKFIYNHFWVLNFMRREFNNGNDLLRPSVTRFATNFITLGILLSHKAGLKRMFTSK